MRRAVSLKRCSDIVPLEAETDEEDKYLRGDSLTQGGDDGCWETTEATNAHHSRRRHRFRLSRETTRPSSTPLSSHSLNSKGGTRSVKVQHNSDPVLSCELRWSFIQ